MKYHEVVETLRVMVKQETMADAVRNFIITDVLDALDRAMRLENMLAIMGYDFRTTEAIVDAQRTRESSTPKPILSNEAAGWLDFVSRFGSDPSNPNPHKNCVWYQTMAQEVLTFAKSANT